MKIRTAMHRGNRDAIALALTLSARILMLCCLTELVPSVMGAIAPPLRQHAREPDARAFASSLVSRADISATALLVEIVEKPFS
jgi:hypothetical protein